MDELNETWAKMINEATAKARSQGRADVAEYLALKFANDQFRATACRWLFDSFVELSDKANRRGIKLEIENINLHRFAVGHSTMVGSLLKLKRGVKNLTIEAGWTRTPQDGFIRGNGLARARISHFGMSKQNVELLLVRSAENVPQWFAIDREEKRRIFNSTGLQNHFDIFLG